MSFPLCFLALLLFHRHLLLTRDDRKGAIESIKFYHGSHCDAQEVVETFEREHEVDSKGVSYYGAFTTPQVRRGVMLGVCALMLQTFSGRD